MRQSSDDGIRRRAAFVILGLALAAAVFEFRTGFVGFDVWRPFLRDRSYRALVADFNRAVPRKSDFMVPLSTQALSARVRANDVVTVTFSDETAGRKLYEYLDKSYVISVRTAGEILYVHWNHTMVGSKYWLMAYDLSTRRELARARVDPTDLRAQE